MTPKQRKFAEEYARTMNAFQSCVAAGYTENYANTKGPKQLLSHPEVMAEITRLRNRLNERADKSATDVVNEYAKIAFADRVDFLKEDPIRPGNYVYKAPHELTDEQRSVVDKVIVHDNVRIVVIENDEPRELFRQEYEYVLSDKSNALQQMGRHFGIFDDKLKLQMIQNNPFKNATPEQLAQLRQSFVGIMSKGETVDGEYTEAKNVLPHDKRRTGSG